MLPLHLPKTGLNIARASLPQVKSTDVPDYLRWLSQHKHYTSFKTEMPVASLFPSQGNFNQSKIRAFMTHKRDELRKPVIVSADYFLIDGHHRWLALLNMDPTDTIPVIMVHAKVLDLIAATKEYPKSFTKNVVESFAVVTEAAEKHTVVSFGRFNPPTAGHAKLVHKVHEVAQEHHADHHVILSHTHDNEKNPLSPADKLKHAKRAFPGTHVTVSSPKHPTIFHHAALLHKAGTKHLHVVVGSDRTKEFHDSLHKYNGTFDKEGHGCHLKEEAEIEESLFQRKEYSMKDKPWQSTWRTLELSKLENKALKQMPNSPAQKETRKQIDDLIKKLRPNVEESLLTEGVHDAGIFKAVFVTGGTGSGKDFVMKKSLHGHGLTEINSDTAFEHLLGKGGLSKKMPESEKEKRDAVRERAKSITDLRQRLAIHGRNGLIINSTGARVDQIKKLKAALEELGYDSKMVFVDASDNVSRNRNIERGQRGGRAIPEELRAKKWREAQDARVPFSKMFGQEHYHEFNNDEDLRHNTDPEIHSQKTAELDDLFKTVKKFTQTPAKHPMAQEWIHRNLGKLAKQPIGNKKQQKAVVPAHSDSQATEEARKLGLQYYGYGKYGKNSRVSHFSLHGKLIEKQKALKPPKPIEQPKAPKKLNEAFEELLKENDHGTLSDLRTSGAVESMGLVVGPEVLARELQHVLAESGTSDDSMEYPDLRDCHEEIQESTQEKVSFGAFRQRLVLPDSRGSEEGTGTLCEGEAIIEPGTEAGAILGTGSNELNDPTNGGKATSGPKKTLRKFRGDIK